MHRWRVRDASTATVFDVLADADHYGKWWPQVRRVQRLSDDVGLVWVRSALPITLRLRLTRRVTDPDAGALAVAIAGDLRGWARWEVRDDPLTPGAVIADYRQQVAVIAPLLRRAAAYARPVVIANHHWMMRSGERGLRRRLRAP